MNLIDYLMQEHFERECVEYPLAKMLMFSEDLDYLEGEEDGDVVCVDSGVEVCPIMAVGQWTPTFKPLTPNHIKPQPSKGSYAR